MTASAGRPTSNGSKGSAKSRASLSGAYRTLSKTSFVDESLFGKSKAGDKATTAQPSASPKIKKTASGMSSLRHGDAVAVTKSELAKMLSPSPVGTVDEIQRRKRAKEEELQARMAQSQARKEKMLKIEEERRKHVPKTETEQLKDKENNGTLSRAKTLLEEEMDDVKHMNQMILYSKCVTIRDAQIEEKRNMMIESEEESRRLDLMMEIERLKAIENYELAEAQRAEERKRGAAVLAQQIEMREGERVREEELRAREREHMLREVERLKEEERKQQVRKKLVADTMMEEVAVANAEQIKRKEVMKEREKAEDARILDYIRQRDKRQQELAMEKERIAKEKELETARLRAQQEKAADKQAEEDELRARRYQEAKEREWRSKELEAKDKEAAIMKDLAVAREAQKAAKIRQLADVARVEQLEFQRVIEASREKENSERQQAEAQVEASMQYKEELLAQVAANEQRRLREQQEKLEEGRRILDDAAREKARLQAIKEKKLKELERAGVPAKYRAELEKKKVGGW